MNVIRSNIGAGARHASVPSPVSLDTEIMLHPTNNGESKAIEFCLAIIDGRALERECFARSIAAHKTDTETLAFSSIDELLHTKDQHPHLSAILLHVGGRNITEPDVAEQIRKLADEFKAVPVIVLADTEELLQILEAFECGACGYVPSTVGIHICIKVITLTLAGGIFVPASSVLAVSQILEANNKNDRPLSGLFTLRQAEVVAALRRGKANKIIAYELNIRESTVKVHVRAIMRKLKATNRTEVAYKIKDFFLHEGQ